MLPSLAGSLDLKAARTAHLLPYGMGSAQLMPTVTSAAGEMLHARDTAVSRIDADATRRLVTIGACECLTVAAVAVAAAHQPYNCNEACHSFIMS